jgi:hypothetical protein
MEVSGQLHALAALPSQGESSWYPLDRRLGGSQSRSGRCVKEVQVLFPVGAAAKSSNSFSVARVLISLDVGVFREALYVVMQMSEMLRG